MNLKPISYLLKNWIATMTLSLFVFSADSTAQPSDLRLLEEINLNRNTAFDREIQIWFDAVYPLVIGIPCTQLVAGLMRGDSAHISRGVSMLAAISLNYFTTLTLKYTVQRNRPFIDYPHIQNVLSPTGPSWPSGHTSNAFALATSLSLQYPQWYVIVPASLWASSIAYTRLHLGLHYPGDVLAGAIVGIASAFATHLLNRWIQGKYNYTRALRLTTAEYN